MVTLAERCALDAVVKICTCVALGGGHDAAHRAMWAETLNEALAVAPRIAAPQGVEQAALATITAHASDLCKALRAEAKGGPYVHVRYDLRTALLTLIEYRAGRALDDMRGSRSGGRHA